MALHNKLCGAVAGSLKAGRFAFGEPEPLELRFRGTGAATRLLSNFASELVIMYRIFYVMNMKIYIVTIYIMT